MSCEVRPVCSEFFFSLVFKTFRNRDAQLLLHCLTHHCENIFPYIQSEALILCLFSLFHEKNEEILLTNIPDSSEYCYEKERLLCYKGLGNGEMSFLYSGIYMLFASPFNDTTMYTIQSIGTDMHSLEFFYIYIFIFLILHMGLCFTGFSLSV